MIDTLRKFKILLYPISFLYGLVIGIRNWMFDASILPTHKHDLPVISVGNITVGGTGKTPHTEYLLYLLSDKMKVAMLSRGYKRKTRGFVLADANANCDTIGDEPFQILRKFKNVLVAVDGNRNRGINKIINSEKGKTTEVIVLDDAYQHRFVEPGINILLTDYNRLITDDHLLPVGNLREPADNKKRANIVIVTKCPEKAQPIDFRLVTKDLALYPYQNLYFTKYEYFEIEPLFPVEKEVPVTLKDISEKGYEIMLVTGIVSQELLLEHLLKYTNHLQSMEYPDHHDFELKDMQDIEQKFSAIERNKKLIIVTEKDAARLLNNSFIPDTLKAHIYYIPLKVAFLFGQEKDFNAQILGYVSKNKTNRGLFKK